MTSPEERRLVGLEHLAVVTELLQRVRGADPTAGLFEAADLQWWWRIERRTDVLPQLVWFDEFGRPTAAVVATAWQDRVAVDPIVLPDATPAWLTHVMERGLDHAAALGLAPIGLEVRRTDEVLRSLLERRGFGVTDDGVVETWMHALRRPEIGQLPVGYRSAMRLDTGSSPHHLIARNGRDVEQRLRQTSLYRTDLDVVVLDEHDDPCAYGLFWFDPTTLTGLVEPMFTDEAHRRRGLARHVLTVGIERLAAAGARRIKICYEPGNAAARDLYLGAGFEPIAQTDLFTDRPASAPT